MLGLSDAFCAEWTWGRRLHPYQNRRKPRQYAYGVREILDAGAPAVTIGGDHSSHSLIKPLKIIVRKRARSMCASSRLILISR